MNVSAYLPSCGFLGELCTHIFACFLNWVVFLFGGSGSSRFKSFIGRALCKVFSQSVAGLSSFSAVPLEEQNSSSHEAQFIHCLLWLILVLYLRTLFLTQSYKYLLLRSLLEILVLDYICRSTILS